MSTFTYPGPYLRAIPAFAIDVPDGWNAVEAAAVLGAFVAPTAEGGFTANVVVGIERAAPGVALADIAAMTLEGDQPAGFALEDERLVDLADGTAVVRRQSFDEPRIGERLTQLLGLLLVAPDPAAAGDLVTVTGTCLSARADVDVPPLLDALTSFRLVA